MLGQQPVLDNTTPEEPIVHDVLIIGGGFAGLGAAQQLLDKDVTTNFAILEGRNHLGGRAYTDYNGLGPGLVTEMGAAWMYPGTNLLNLAENQLTGRIPSEIGQLELLNTFDISDNAKILGNIPTEVGLLTNLKSWGK